MSDKEPPNPFEELQRQLQEALRSSGGTAGMSGLNPSASQPQPQEPEKDTETEDALRGIREFDRKPREIRDYLNRFVIKQNEAKKVLSVAICDHYNHVRRCIESPELTAKDYNKQNIILLGPTGVGKTYLMRNIAKLIGVPFVKADATKFSETGYVGNDVEDLVRDLVKSANGNTDLAQYGIIYIDEIDKIASAGGGERGGRDVSGRGVQINLLKLMEETEVNLFSPNDMMSQMQAMMEVSRGGKPKKRTISTRHMLFIVSGAFDGLAEDVKKRIDKAQIGFASSPDKDDDDLYDYLKCAETPDFLNYGFEPEFVGRLPVRVACESLRAPDLVEVLSSSEGSILRQYKEDFEGYGVDFSITPEAIEEIALRASKEKTGARGLMTILERLFRDLKFELPSTAITSFEVTSETVNDPLGTLKQLMVENEHLMEEVYKGDIQRYADEFARDHDGLKLTFTDDAAKALIAESVENDRTIRSLCEEKFHDYQHGLMIISRNTEQREFTITETCIANPDKELSQWVVESFKKAEAQKENESED